MHNPAIADALYAVGHWLLAQERSEDAKHVFRTMLVTSPTDERGWLALGAAHETKGELEQAARLYALAEVASPGGLRCPIALARLQRRRGHDEEAAALYERVAREADEAGDEALSALIAGEMAS
jgi:tetratricopeptide (TPR) repeat protein